MSVANCSLGRDVHLYAASDPTEVLCGLVLTNGVTNANFYLMVEIILIFDSDYYLQDAGDTMVGRDDHPFQLGNYYMVIGGFFSINSESWLVHTSSVSSGTCVRGFRDAVRERDRRCVITGREALDAQWDMWTGFEAVVKFDNGGEVEGDLVVGGDGENSFLRSFTAPGITTLPESSKGSGHIPRQNVSLMLDRRTAPRKPRVERVTKAALSTGFINISQSRIVKGLTELMLKVTSNHRMGKGVEWVYGPKILVEKQFNVVITGGSRDAACPKCS